MKVTSVEIRNYRGIADLTLPLHPQLTVLHGQNGSGKTSILNAIALVMDGPGFRGDQVSYADMREGASGPEIILNLRSGEIQRTDGKNGRWIHIHSPGGEGGDHGSLLGFVFYDVDRTVVTTLMPDAQPPSSYPTRKYVNVDLSPEYSELFKWFYAKENEELRERQARRDFDYRLPDLSAVRDAMSTMVDGVSRPHIRVAGPPRLAFDVEDTGTDAKTLTLEQLSDGYRNVLAMAADIGWYLARVPKTSRPPVSIVVLIDEIELHLHPEWQQRVLGDLMRTFPDVQFVVTTHSPQVLTTIHPEHIVELAVEDGRVVAGGAAGPTYGAAAGDVLAGGRGVERRPDNEFTRLLREYERLIGRDKGETDEALQLRARLDELSRADPALGDADMEIRHRKLVRKRKE